jgi:hypothetical protein
MTDARALSRYNFDKSHRSSGVSERAGSLSCSHDLAGNLTQISGGASTGNYKYDTLNRLRTLKEGSVGTTTYAYDNVCNLRSVAYPNDVVHIYGYDNSNIS